MSTLIKARDMSLLVKARRYFVRVRNMSLVKARNMTPLVKARDMTSLVKARRHYVEIRNMSLVKARDMTSLIKAKCHLSRRHCDAAGVTMAFDWT